MRAMTTLMENDLPVSLVMKAIDGPLIVPRKSPGPYGVEVSIERVTWNGSGQSALLADPCDVRIGSRSVRRLKGATRPEAAVATLRGMSRL
jgi:hypothetical protein